MSGVFSSPESLKRHRFLWQKKSELIKLITVLVIITLVLGFLNVSIDVLKRALILGIGFCIHHVFLKYRWYGRLKDLMVASIYLSAVTWVPFGAVLGGQQYGFQNDVLMMTYLGLILINLYSNAFFEYDELKLAKRATIARVISQKRLNARLIVISLWVLIGIWNIDFLPIKLLLSGILSSQWLIIYYQKSRLKDLYRI